MKNLPLVFALFICLHVQAQNLVPNGSFEQYNSCPVAYTQITLCTGWLSFTGASPDYFHSCHTGNLVGVPSNTVGYQPAAQGGGYTGIVAFHTSGYREYITTQIAPMVPGTLYEVSISVALAEYYSAYAVNGFGVYFFDAAPAFYSSGNNPPVTAQVSYASYGVITDSVNWKRLTATFLADSAYDNIAIGAFLPNSGMNVTSVKVGGNDAYYFIDSVVVRAMDRVKINFSDTVFCAGDTINVPYTINGPGYFSTGNIFTLQLSNATGSFASPVNIGSLTSTAAGTIQGILPPGAGGSGYRLRVISSTPADTSQTNGKNILIKPRPFPTAGSNSPICEGSTLNLTATALAGASYTWTGPSSYSSSSQNPSVFNASTGHSGDYIVTATLNGCSAKDTTTVLVKPMPAIPAANNNGPLCPGETLNLTAASSTSNVSYTWTGPASFSSALQDPSVNNVDATNGGAYNVTAALNGCTSAAGQTTVVIKPKPAMPIAGSNSPVCAGGTLNLTASSTTNSVNYNWTGPNNFTSTQQNPTITPVPLIAAGTYRVTATLNSCVSDTGITTVVVNNVSSLGFYSNPNDTLCENSNNATFVALPFNAGTGPQYQWYKNGNLISGAINPTYAAAGIINGDSFHCVMTVTGVCPDPLIISSNKMGITVLPVQPGPSVTITANPPGELSPWQLVTFTATPVNAGADPKYQWKRNGQNVTGATSNTWSAYNLSDNDTVHCEVTSSVWCATPAKDESNKLIVQIKLGVDDIGKISGIKLYPNPNDGRFSLLLTSSQGGGTVVIEIVNAIGQVVYKDVARATTHELKKEIALELSSGIYLLRIKADGETRAMRFTVN